MLRKISILAALGFAAALWVAPARADLIHDWDDDSTPHYSHDVRLDENLKVNAGRFSTFNRDAFKDEKSDFKHRREFPSGVTAGFLLVAFESTRETTPRLPQRATRVSFPCAACRTARRPERRTDPPARLGSETPMAARAPRSREDRAPAAGNR